jgi:hypothetical protein
VLHCSAEQTLLVHSCKYIHRCSLSSVYWHLQQGVCSREDLFRLSRTQVLHDELAARLPTAIMAASRSFSLCLASWLALLLLLNQTTCTQPQLDLQLQSNGKYGLVVPLGVRHGIHRVRGRSLLRSGAMPVLGAIREG